MGADHAEISSRIDTSQATPWTGSARRVARICLRAEGEEAPMQTLGCCPLFGLNSRRAHQELAGVSQLDREKQSGSLLCGLGQREGSTRELRQFERLGAGWLQSNCRREAETPGHSSSASSSGGHFKQSRRFCTERDSCARPLEPDSVVFFGRATLEMVETENKAANRSRMIMMEQSAAGSQRKCPWARRARKLSHNYDRVAALECPPVSIGRRAPRPWAQFGADQARLESGEKGFDGLVIDGQIDAKSGPTSSAAAPSKDKCKAAARKENRRELANCDTNMMNRPGERYEFRWPLVAANSLRATSRGSLVAGDIVGRNNSSRRTEQEQEQEEERPANRGGSGESQLDSAAIEYDGSRLLHMLTFYYRASSWTAALSALAGISGKRAPLLFVGAAASDELFASRKARVSADPADRGMSLELGLGRGANKSSESRSTADRKTVAEFGAAVVVASSLKNHLAGAINEPSTSLSINLPANGRAVERRGEITDCAGSAPAPPAQVDLGRDVDVRRRRSGPEAGAEAGEETQEEEEDAVGRVDSGGGKQNVDGAEISPRRDDLMWKETRRGAGESLAAAAATVASAARETDNRLLPDSATRRHSVGSSNYPNEISGPNRIQRQSAVEVEVEVEVKKEMEGAAQRELEDKICSVELEASDGSETGALSGRCPGRDERGHGEINDSAQISRFCQTFTAAASWSGPSNWPASRTRDPRAGAKFNFSAASDEIICCCYFKRSQPPRPGAQKEGKFRASTT